MKTITRFLVALLALASFCAFGQTLYKGNFSGNGSPAGQPGLTNLNPSGIQQAGATTGQALVWNGSQWVPGTVSGGGGVNQIIAGSNVTVSPPSGLGTVTINASGGSGGTNAFNTNQIDDQRPTITAYQKATAITASNWFTLLTNGSSCTITRFQLSLNPSNFSSNIMCKSLMRIISENGTRLNQFDLGTFFSSYGMPYQWGNNPRLAVDVLYPGVEFSGIRRTEINIWTNVLVQIYLVDQGAEDWYQIEYKPGTPVCSPLRNYWYCYQTNQSVTSGSFATQLPYTTNGPGEIESVSLFLQGSNTVMEGHVIGNADSTSGLYQYGGIEDFFDQNYGGDNGLNTSYSSEACWTGSWFLRDVRGNYPVSAMAVRFLAPWQSLPVGGGATRFTYTNYVNFGMYNECSGPAVFTTLVTGWHQNYP